VCKYVRACTPRACVYVNKTINQLCTDTRLNKYTEYFNYRLELAHAFLLELAHTIMLELTHTFLLEPAHTFLVNRGREIRVKLIYNGR